MSPIMKQLVEQAESHYSDYPQYKGYFRTEGWFVVRIKRTIKRQGFERGDVVLARKGEGFDVPELNDSFVLYNPRRQSLCTMDEKCFVVDRSSTLVDGEFSRC